LGPLTESQPADQAGYDSTRQQAPVRPAPAGFSFNIELSYLQLIINTAADIKHGSVSIGQNNPI
jgi:hypothetical protein